MSYPISTLRGAALILCMLLALAATGCMERHYAPMGASVHQATSAQILNPSPPDQSPAEGMNGFTAQRVAKNYRSSFTIQQQGVENPLLKLLAGAQK